MATETKGLPRGCRPGPGSFSCPEADALWADVDAKYDAAKGTEEWQAYDDALAKYRRHLGFEEESDGD